MAKPEWGTKRQCQSCNAKFYDLQRNPVVCPKCNTVFELGEDEQQEAVAPVAAPAAEKEIEKEIDEIETEVEADVDAAEDDVTVLVDEDDEDPAGDDSTTVRLSDEDDET